MFYYRFLVPHLRAPQDVLVAPLLVLPQLQLVPPVHWVLPVLVYLHSVLVVPIHLQPFLPAVNYIVTITCTVFKDTTQLYTKQYPILRVCTATIRLIGLQWDPLTKIKKSKGKYSLHVGSHCNRTF